MAEQDEIQKIFDGIVKKVETYQPKAEIKLLEKAYEFAKKVHAGQKRLSGEPFIIHPLMVANILADLQQDPKVLIAALLHDSVEDAEVTSAELVKEFGEEVAKLVEGATKLGQLVFESKEERQAENFRKMFLAMGEDLRVVIMKLADRLHNMQTLKYLSSPRQKSNAIETREIFAPLAHRLGMWRIKWELEDLAFRYLDQKQYDSIREKVTDSRSSRDTYVNNFIAKVKAALEAMGVQGEIFGRPKHFYSIYRKMVEQNLEFEELYDLLAIRIIVPSVRECYAALGVLHAHWKPLPGRFRDYIAMPKSNGYQSLHTTVVGDEGKPVEIQIRTTEMHRIAEYGIAAHWRYKEGETDRSLDSKMTWIRQMLDWQKDLSDAKDFMENLKVDLFGEEVFVFSPKGSVHDFPQGATPVDFAYRVHTEVGHRCVGAKINGRIVPLETKMKNGDIVEILTGKNNNPSLDWLNFANTSAARTKIKSFFKKQRTEENLERGENTLRAEIKKMQLSPDSLLSGLEFEATLAEFNQPSLQALYIAVGCGEVSAYQFAKALREKDAKHEAVPPLEEEAIKPMLSPSKRKKKGLPIEISGLQGVLVKISRCCRPLPGEEIVGYVTKGRGVAIHRRDCPNLSDSHTQTEKLIAAKWNPASEETFPIDVEVEAFDRVGVLKDILEKVAEVGTNVSAANVKTKRGSMAIIKLGIDVKNVNHLNQVFAAIRKVSDVYEVARFDIFRKGSML